MRLIATIVAAAALGVSGLAAERPATGTRTAGCVAPATAVKQLICDDPHLSHLNHRLKTAYHSALARPGVDRAALRSARRDWKTARDGCAYNADVRTCVLEAYQPAGFGPLTARFYDKLVPPASVLNWKGDHQPLFIGRSGSGDVRDGRRGYSELNEVSLDFDGATFTCDAP